MYSFQNIFWDKVERKGIHFVFLQYHGRKYQSFMEYIHGNKVHLLEHIFSKIFIFIGFISNTRIT